MGRGRPPNKHKKMRVKVQNGIHASKHIHKQLNIPILKLSPLYSVSLTSLARKYLKTLIKVRTYIHTCMHAYVRAHVHTCMHTYIHTYIYKLLEILIQLEQCM